jgi:hypothetical protein
MGSTSEFQWIAQTCGDGVGFDVLSFDEVDDSERFIEVKTTGLGKHFRSISLRTSYDARRTGRNCSDSTACLISVGIPGSTWYQAPWRRRSGWRRSSIEHRSEAIEPLVVAVEDPQGLAVQAAQGIKVL